jgi:hypothetical protein
MRAEKEELKASNPFNFSITYLFLTLSAAEAVAATQPQSGIR